MTGVVTRLAVVQFSTGMASAEVALRLADADRPMVLLTADTTIEDADNWRFAEQVYAACKFPEWVVLRDGRHPMQVGRDERVIPSDRMAVCSRILKRELIRRYIEDRWPDPVAIEVLLGFDWTEHHRHEASVPHWQPYLIDSPLTRPPYWQKGDLVGFVERRGIDPPRLYSTGSPHANCGGGCVRSGQVEWRRLLFSNRGNPDTVGSYLWWEAEEETSRQMLGDFAIMRHRGGPDKDKPLPLRLFRERLEKVPNLFDHEDFGGCGCDPWGTT